MIKYIVIAIGIIITGCVNTQKQDDNGKNDIHIIPIHDTEGEKSTYELQPTDKTISYRKKFVCSNYCSDLGPAMSVEKYGYIYGKINIRFVTGILQDRLKRLSAFTNSEFIRERESKNGFRLTVIGMKSMVLKNKSSFEKVTITVSIISTGREEPKNLVEVSIRDMETIEDIDFKIEQIKEELEENDSDEELKYKLELLNTLRYAKYIKNIIKTSYSNLCLRGGFSDAKDEVPEYDEIELIIDVSGLYKLGGKPSNIKGYEKDFIAEGYSEELKVFASFMYELIEKAVRESKPVKSKIKLNI